LVLVIDDSPTFSRALAESLGVAGFDVATASSGEAGLRMAATRRPTGIIVDGVMPDISGETVIRRIRLDPALRTTPCLLLTGSDDAVAEIHALDAGADAFARKEADIDVILARVAAMLRSAREGASDDTTSALGPQRILAVDDSVTYLHALADQLHDEGYDVVQASSGEQALELLAVQPVDCILLDLVMPGLSGIETCRRIKLAPAVRDTPLVMLTSREGREAMIEGLSAGADDFVSKSAGHDVLSARLKAQIRRKKFVDEHRHVRERLLRSERDATEARAARELAETRAALAGELERTNRELAAANRELEAFSYTVSHDLRAPLRAITRFTRALYEDCSDNLDSRGHDYIRRVQVATGRMEELIDDLLQFARVGRAELRKRSIDLSATARTIAALLQERDPERAVEIQIADGIVMDGDLGLVRTMLENLLSNAWKFSGRRDGAVIEVGVTERDGGRVCYVRDNGVGFDASHAAELFLPFRRLHTTTEFEGTGIGLATVQRIIERHGGRVWAESATGAGATIYFTL
jgi:two-component system, NtrC family, sensor kinase